MTCPKCGAAMEAVVIGEVEVDRCTACKGIWFDSGEDEKVKGQARKIDIGKPNPKGGERAKIDCPRCKAPMISMVVLDQPHIRYESCTVCYGMFFDAGEFVDAAEETLGDVWKRLKR